jgi:hypothetical protein
MKLSENNWFFHKHGLIILKYSNFVIVLRFYKSEFYWKFQISQILKDWNY